MLGPLSRVHTHPETCRVALRDLSAVANRGFLPLLLPEYTEKPPFVCASELAGRSGRAVRCARAVC